jgi:toluene monooxygenase system protein A
VKHVREAVGRGVDFEKLPAGWLNAVKLHAATLPLAEFAAVVGNLRAARFGRTSAWRNMAAFGALDEMRHCQIPLQIFHELVKWDRQFDWAHKFYHSNDWVAVAARHLFDELLITSDPIDFAVGTHFVFETGFTNLQFIGLASLAHDTGDRMFEKMVQSIQTDEARHAQIGGAVLKILVQHDKARAQSLLDKWFWRTWQVFAVVTGFSMDYLTPLSARKRSFKEFMDEWIIDQFLTTIEDLGLAKPWYWDTFLQATETFHHMVYASAYTYRATVWFNMVVPGPEEREWLARHYPDSWAPFDQVWERVSDKWRAADPGLDFAVHGTAIVTFCDLCQLVLCGGTPDRNSATCHEHGGKRYIFCSEPCKAIFQAEPERYASHKDIVKRVLAGDAPGNVLALITRYFGLTFDDWGKDAHGGVYDWLPRPKPGRSPVAGAPS